MVSIVLTDQHGMIHEVFVVPSCSPLDAEHLEMCAAAYGLYVTLREATVVSSTIEACIEIGTILETKTEEVEAYTGPIGEPAIEIHHPSTIPAPSLCEAICEAFSTPILELDWEDAT